MAWLRGTPTTNMAITVEQAKALAQTYLDATNNGTSVGQTTVYYGFYTMQVLKDGNPVGMMAIYGTTGTATYYSWLGTFMQQKTAG